MAETVPGGALIWQLHYDRDMEADTEKHLMDLTMWLQEWNSRNTRTVGGIPYVSPIKDSQAIGEIRKVFSQTRILLMGYREWDAAALIKGYLDWLNNQRVLDAVDTLKNLDMLAEIIAKDLKRKHNFRDKVEKERKWDQELKKKLEFPDLTQEERKYYDTIDREWKKLAWLITYYVVKLGGDAHILLSGPNLSGKSNTAIRFLKKCNWYLMHYWNVNKYNEFHTEKHPELKDVKQDKFDIERDVYINIDPNKLRRRFEEEQYQCIDINESMETATNLQSMKTDVIELGVKRYTTRSYHNIVIWEYQVQTRPTAMMLEGMNFWFQKMKKRHFILSVASTLVRKKDPYYMKELEKCRSDKEIGKWMEDLNPNYIHTFRAPKLSENEERKFQVFYWKEKDLQLRRENVRVKTTKDYDLIVADMWERINKYHLFSILELDGELEKMGFNKRDRESFMRDYGKYNRVMVYEQYQKKHGPLVAEETEKGTI